jgi:hypothetical protein
MDHLVDAVRRASLLAVAEGGVRDHDVAGADRRRIEFDQLAVDLFQQRAVETDLRGQIVIKRCFQQIRDGRIDQRVLFSRGMSGHNRTPCKS